MLCLMIALVSACFIACGNDDDDSFGGSGNTEVPGGTVSPERTFNVEKAGTLPDKISEVDMYKIKSLKLSGVLNGTDILFLRKMMGVSEKGAATGGQLEYLDISDTKIVEGGDGYYISGGGFSYHTSYDKIGMYMFLGVRALKTILLPNGVTSIGGDVFSGCTSLTTINIPDGVTSIGASAFSGCTSLTTISIPDGVTSIGASAFSRCTSLTTMSIPDGVTLIGASTFSGCTSLTTISIPDGVTWIGASAFSDCTSLTIISIPDGVTSIGDDVFNGCTSLTTISIPDGVTSIGDYAFNGCTSLTTISIPGSVTWIGKAAFRYSGIGAIYFTSHTPPTIHWENRNLYITYIYVPKGCKSNYENIFLSYGEIIEYDPNNK